MTACARANTPPWGSIIRSPGSPGKSATRTTGIINRPIRSKRRIRICRAAFPRPIGIVGGSNPRSRSGCRGVEMRCRRERPAAGGCEFGMRTMKFPSGVKFRHFRPGFTTGSNGRASGLVIVRRCRLRTHFTITVRSPAISRWGPLRRMIPNGSRSICCELSLSRRWCSFLLRSMRTLISVFPSGSSSRRRTTSTSGASVASSPTAAPRTTRGLAGRSSGFP